MTVNLSKNSPKNMSAQRVCFYVLGDVKFLTIFSFFIGSLKAADLLQLMKNTNLPRNLLVYTIVFFSLSAGLFFLEHLLCWYPDINFKIDIYITYVKCCFRLATVVLDYCNSFTIQLRRSQENVPPPPHNKEDPINYK